MPLYVGDYLADTTDLTTLQHGAYLLLLFSAWKRGGRLPNDSERLRQITRLERDEWAIAEPILRAFFTVDGSDLVHKRVAAEYESATKAHAAQLQNGKKGGRPANSKRNVPRGPEPKDNPRVSSGLTQTVTHDEPNGEPTANPNLTPSPSQEDIDIDREGESGFTRRFELAWSRYPKREGSNSKKDAYTAWKARIAAGVKPEDLVEGVVRYALFCDGTDKTGTQFVLQAATFFGPSNRHAEPWTFTPRKPTSIQSGAAGKRAPVAAASDSDVEQLQRFLQANGGTQ